VRLTSRHKDRRPTKVEVGSIRSVVLEEARGEHSIWEIENIESYDDGLEKLIARWRKDAAQYQRQVEESRSKGLPHDMMFSAMTYLRQCADQLEAEKNLLTGDK